MTSRYPWVAVLAVSLAGCSTLQVKTEYDASAAFPSYRSYAWLATAPGAEQAAAIRNPAVRTLVVTAIDREMAKKGLVRTTTDANPDFYVSVIGWGQSRVEVTSYGYGYAPGMYHAYPAVAVEQYTNGTLLLDFVDAKTKALFWRGTAADTFNSPDEVQAKIDEAAKELLAAYPPPAKK
jgi:hypothetical protein